MGWRSPMLSSLLWMQFHVSVHIRDPTEPTSTKSPYSRSAASSSEFSQTQTNPQTHLGGSFLGPQIVRTAPLFDNKEHPKTGLELRELLTYT